MNKIPGTPLLGFSDYFSNVNEAVGATKPAAKFVAPTKPGVKPAPKGPMRQVKPIPHDSSKGPHGQALFAAATASKKAVEAAKQAKVKTKKHDAASHAPLAKVAVTASVAMVRSCLASSPRT